MGTTLDLGGKTASTTVILSIFSLRSQTGLALSIGSSLGRKSAAVVETLVVVVVVVVVFVVNIEKSISGFTLLLLVLLYPSSKTFIQRFEMFFCVSSDPNGYFVYDFF